MRVSESEESWGLRLIGSRNKELLALVTKSLFNLKTSLSAMHRHQYPYPNQS